MKSVLLLLLGGIGLAAQAQESPVTDAKAVQVAAETSFVSQSQSAPAQLPDVNEQDGADKVLPSFVSETQNQAMMLGGLLAAGFLVRRRRDH
ncbi:hypothetical protein CS062_04170 [Roseateles chitinivorans]|jgi:hypothetical protein|uniref:LPXTG cell wall anchor domain-containing protein n=1 Tax=Roseateles chitinivorans TaxID=2917965 RepID=A0A2G9CG26_9BURK|nr:hypothetical protein [Roseateles chitinivorans]PIM54584.1 hypothetical protein CS062_04170 [Roseateles chitinivorans]